MAKGAGKLLGDYSKRLIMTESVAKEDGILCCNILHQEGTEQWSLWRHPLFAYEETLSWPPEGWESIACWHCCNTFTSAPCTAPHSFDRKRSTFNVSGIFCSWSCAKAYILEQKSWSSRERLLLLEELARRIHPLGEKSIPTAPPRLRLKMFGGDLTIEQFREESALVRSSVAVPYPLVTQPLMHLREGNVYNNGQKPWSVKGLRSNKTATNQKTIDQIRTKETEAPSLFSDFIKKDKPNVGDVRVCASSQDGDKAIGPGSLTFFMKKRKGTEG